MLTPTLTDDAPKSPLVADGNNENTTAALPNFEKLSKSNIDHDILGTYFNARASKIAQFIHPSKNASALIEIGDKHISKGRTQSALQAYKNAVKLDPDMVEAYKKLIPTLLSRGNVKGADYYYSCLIDLTSSHPDYLHGYLLFRIAFFGNNEGEYSRIEDKLHALVSQNPKNTQILNTQGVFDLVYKKDKTAAKKYFNDALSIDSKNVDAINNLGIILQRESKSAKAIELYKKAISINPRHIAAYENLSSVLLSQDRVSETLKILTKAESLGLDLSKEWNHNIGWLLLLDGQLEKAKAWYLNKIEEEPHNNLLFNNLAVCLEELKEEQDALKNYQKATEIYLDRKSKDSSLEDHRAYHAFYNLMRLLQKKGNFKLLEIISKKILNIDRSNALGLYYRGSARLQLRKFKSAKESLQLALARDKKLLSAYLDLSFILITEDRDYDAAIQTINECLRNGISDDLVLTNLAYAYVKSGELKKAKETLGKLADANIPNATATRGLISYYEGDFKGGNKYYEDAIGRISPARLSESRQVWLYEQANYWLRNSNIKKSKTALSKAKSLGNVSFIYRDILSLEAEIKEQLKR